MPLLIPNIHVALIHFPIALLLVGVAIECVCTLAYRASSARVAGRWMILFAAALGWPAAYSGIYAIRSTAGADHENATWAEIRAGSPAWADAGAWETLRGHLLINGGAVALATLVVVVWLMSTDRARRRLHVPGLLLLVLASAAVIVGAWHGGELIHWHDVTHVRASPGIDSGVERAVEWTPTTVAPPLDAHVALAGWATGMCLLAWAVAARPRGAQIVATGGAGATPKLVDPQRDRIFAAFQPATLDPAAEPPRTMLALLATLALVATAALGVWSIANGYETWSPAVLWRATVDADDATGPVSRRLAHALGGVTLVGLTLAVGIAGRRSRRGRALPLMMGTLMLAALAAQAWLGVLLLLDSNGGPLTRAN